MSEDKNVNKKGFWKGMKSELKKVIWPTGEQTIKSTFATIAFVILVSLILIVFNYAFNWLSTLWIRSLSHEDVINNVVISSGETEAISGEMISDVQESGEDISEAVPTNVEDTNEEVAEPVTEISGE